MKNYIIKNSIQSIVCIAILFLTSAQLSAQCSNINAASTKDRPNPNTHMFNQQSFGQSIAGSCFSGNQITKISFWSQGNSPTKMNLKIYEANGQTVSGNPIYTHPQEISSPPTNHGGKLSVTLAQPVAVQSGKTYTFVFTMTGGNQIVHISDNTYSGGQFYQKKDGVDGFLSKYDMRFEVEASTGNSPKITVYEHGGYSGSKKELGVGSYATPSSFSPVGDNKISAVQIPSGYKVILYDGANFSGNSLELNSSTNALWVAPHNFNDKASSIKVIKL